MADSLFEKFKETSDPKDSGVPSPVRVIPETEPEPVGNGIIAPIGDNLLGATSAFHLRMAEAAAGSIRVWEAMVGDVYLPGNYDAEHLRDIHAHVMQDIYPEPGATRGDERLLAEYEARTNPSKEKPIEYDTRLGANEEGITLLSAGRVNERLDELSALMVKENHLRGLEKPAFLDKLTDYYLQYSKASPFIAGNQKVLDVVFHQIGEQAGYSVVLGKDSTNLAQVTDAILAAGTSTNKGRLMQVFNAVTTESEGVGPQALRSPTLRRLPLVLSDEMKKRQTEEDMAQAGSKLIGRVGGQEEERFKAGMRALIEGNPTSEHINNVRTTAMRHTDPELALDTARIEKGAGLLDGYRRTQQQQERQLEQSRSVQRQPERSAKSELTP